MSNEDYLLGLVYLNGNPRARQQRHVPRYLVIAQLYLDMNPERGELLTGTGL